MEILSPIKDNQETVKKDSDSCLIESENGVKIILQGSSGSKSAINEHQAIVSEVGFVSETRNGVQMNTRGSSGCEDNADFSALLIKDKQEEVIVSVIDGKQKIVENEPNSLSGFRTNSHLNLKDSVGCEKNDHSLFNIEEKPEIIISVIEEKQENVENQSKSVSVSETVVQMGLKDSFGCERNFEAGSGKLTEEVGEKQSIAEAQMGFSDAEQKQDGVEEFISQTQNLVEGEPVNGSILEAQSDGRKMFEFKLSGESTKEYSGITETLEKHAMVETVVQKADEKLNNVNRNGNCTSEIKEVQEMVENTERIVSKIGKDCGKERRFMASGKSSEANGKNMKQEMVLGKKEKCSKRRSKGIKKVTEINGNRNMLDLFAEARNAFQKKEDGSKRCYSKNEMEVLRFVNVEKQQKMWNEIYLRLGPSVARELDDMEDSKHQTQGHRNVFQHRHFGKKKEAIIISEACSQNMENDIKEVNPLDPTCVDHTNGRDDYMVECSEDVDSDDEYDSIQKPAFLVEGEPNFESGPPQDGLEYLRRVRWEAAQIPKVTVAKLDSTKLKNEQTIYMPKIPDIAVCPEHLLPLKHWEDAFLTDFSELRQILSSLESSDLENNLQLFSTVDEDDSSQHLESPSLENSDNLCSFSMVDGNDLCLNSGDPMLSVILGMDFVARALMLKSRIRSLETMSSLSRDDCMWIFSLCAAIDTPLDGDTTASLRCLLRKCSSLRAVKSECDDEVVMLNMLVTISGRYFRQADN